MPTPKITKLEVIVFEFQLADLGTDYNGFNLVYEKGNILTRRQGVFRLHTSLGVVGEYSASRTDQRT